MSLKNKTNDIFWMGGSTLDESFMKDFSGPSSILESAINCTTYKQAVKAAYVFEKSIFLGRYKIYSQEELVWEAMTDEHKSLMCGNQ